MGYKSKKKNLKKNKNNKKSKKKILKKNKNNKKSKKIKHKKGGYLAGLYPNNNTLKEKINNDIKRAKNNVNSLSITPHLGNNNISRIETQSEFLKLIKSKLLNISFDEYVKLASTPKPDYQELIKYDNYYLFYQKILKGKDNLTIFEDAIKFLINDAIKRLVDHNFCSYYDSQSSCNKNLYCKFDTSEQICKEINANKGPKFRELNEMNTFDRSSMEPLKNLNTGTNTKHISLKNVTQYRLVDGKIFITEIKDMHEKEILYELYLQMKTILDENNYDYKSVLILILNYLLLLSHITYKYHTHVKKIKYESIYQNISISTIKIIKIINTILSNDNSIVIPHYTNPNYPYFIKMGEIPLYISSIHINETIFVHNTHMLPVIYTWHDLVHISHYIRKRNKKGYNFMIGNNNKILLWYFINLYKNNIPEHSFYNRRRMKKEEIHKREHLSKFMIILLFNIIHESHTVSFDNIKLMIDKLSLKKYHSGHYDTFTIIDTLWMEYIKSTDVNPELSNNFIKKKFNYPYGIDRSKKSEFYYEFVQALLLLIYICQNLDKPYMSHEYLQNTHINEIMKTLNESYGNIYLKGNSNFEYYRLLDPSKKTLFDAISGKLKEIGRFENYKIKLFRVTYKDEQFITLIDALKIYANNNTGRSIYNDDTFNEIIKKFFSDMDKYFLIELFIQDSLNEELYEYMTNEYTDIWVKFLILSDIVYDKKNKNILQGNQIKLLTDIREYYSKFYKLKATILLGIIGLINKVINYLEEN